MSIFQDIFSCDEIDPQGKKFDTGDPQQPNPTPCPLQQEKLVPALLTASLLAPSVLAPPVPAAPVSRMVCKSENYEMDMTLDVNSDLLAIERGFKFSVELATTLNLDNTPDTGARRRKITKRKKH